MNNANRLLLSHMPLVQQHHNCSLQPEHVVSLYEKEEEAAFLWKVFWVKISCCLAVRIPSKYFLWLSSWASQCCHYLSFCLLSFPNKLNIWENLCLLFWHSSKTGLLSRGFPSGPILAGLWAAATKKQQTKAATLSFVDIFWRICKVTIRKIEKWFWLTNKGRYHQHTNWFPSSLRKHNR